jgi:hypothetical protein
MKEGCCHSDKGILGCDYMRSYSFVIWQKRAYEWNKKLEKKLAQITRRINNHEDYSDAGLEKLLALDAQRSELVEIISANNLKAIEGCKNNDEFHVY